LTGGGAAPALLPDLRQGLDRVAGLDPGGGWLDLGLAIRNGVPQVAGEAGWRFAPGWSIFGQGWLERAGWGAMAGVRGEW